ncbi:MAG: MFS transporter [Eubacteriales bacterium]|nr:MFS transporter [Eubacteriales bacterium]
MKKQRVSPAMAFILLMGLIALFSDMTHEGARSILGAYLGLAGASAAAVGFVSGLGEFAGYSLRLLTGIITDKTKRYWLLTILGYAVDVLAIPALALVPQNGWVFACALVVLERIGKAIKKPAKNTLISFAASETGAGKGFAIQEFVDQIGAFLGPVALFLVLLVRQDGDTFSAYRLCFLVLGIPALITIALLFFARHKYPHPENFEQADETPVRFRANAAFWTYIAGIGCLAFGFIDFPLITLHISRQALVPADTLPLLYAGAMVVDAFAALWFGFLFDRHGIRALILSTAVSAVSAAFIFSFTGLWATLLGILSWGVGMGAQESILKSVVKSVVPKANRAAGFGVFETAFGAAWFVGSLVTGLLYDASRTWMVIVSVGMQLAAIPLLWRTMRLRRGENAGN